LAALTLLAPAFYPWYAAMPIAVLATCADTATARRLAVIESGLALIVAPNGLGLAILTKLPGSAIVAALVAWAGWRRLRRPSTGDHPARFVTHRPPDRNLDVTVRVQAGRRDTGR
jgi:membrane protein implicated in regulation of membrane protease activity